MKFHRAGAGRQAGPYRVEGWKLRAKSHACDISTGTQPGLHALSIRTSRRNERWSLLGARPAAIQNITSVTWASGRQWTMLGFLRIQASTTITVDVKISCLKCNPNLSGSCKCRLVGHVHAGRTCVAETWPSAAYINGLNRAHCKNESRHSQLLPRAPSITHTHKIAATH